MRSALRSCIIVLTAIAATALSATALPASASALTPTISAGPNSTCFTSELGVLRCMGANDRGQLGPVGSGSADPLASPTVVPSSEPVRSVSQAIDHSCALLTGGSVICRGNNAVGQLGSTTDTGVNVAHPDGFVVPLPGPASAIKVDQQFSCAVLAAGSLYCWGTNQYGQLGSSPNLGTTNPNPAPLQATLAVNATAVALGPFFGCVLAVDTHTYCWGQNSRGQGGTASNVGTMSANLPTLAEKVPAGALSISAWFTQTCVVSAAQTADCMGQNQYGELASTVNIGTGNPNNTPNTANLGGAPVKQVAAGSQFACALTTASEIWCWGDNHWGNLGNNVDVGSDVAHPTPAKVAGLPAPAVAISAAWSHVCAILQTGAIVCWGNNGSGQLGQPLAVAQSSSPLVVPGVNVLDAPIPKLNLQAGKLKFTFKRSGKKIRASAKIRFTADGTLSATSCSGKVSTRFYSTRRVGKKIRTHRYAKGSARLSFAKSRCSANVVMRLSRSAAGKRLRFSIAYSGNAAVASYSKKASIRIRVSRRQLHH